MKAIQIRNVPDDVHAALQRRAGAAGQSMQEYLLALLREHTERPTMAEWLAVAGSQKGGRLSFEDAVAWQREERDSR
jgi:plasmid stability protein